MDGQSPYVSLSEAGKLSGYSAEYLRQLCVKGKLTGQKVGKSWVISKDEIDTFIKQGSVLGPPTLAELNSASFSFLPAKSRFAAILVGLVVGLPATAALVLSVPDGLSALKTEYREVMAGMQEAAYKGTADYFTGLFNPENWSGKVAGSVIASEAKQSLPRGEIATQPAVARDDKYSIPNSPSVLGISNSELIAAFRAVLAEGLPSDIQGLLKGDKGDPGMTVSYTLPTSSNTSSMGSIAGFTHLSGNDLTTKDLTVTNNITQTGGTASFSTLTVGGADVVTLTGIQTLTNKTLTTPTLTNPVITNISPGANFTLTQNSVVPFTSVNAGAVVNTLYLSSGNIGIGTNNPNVKLDISGNLRVMNQGEVRFADADSSNYVGFKSSSVVGSNQIWTLPSADASGCFKSNGAGLISIDSCSASAVSAGGLTNDFRGLQLRTSTDGDALKKVTMVHADEIVMKDGTRHTPANNLHADITVVGIGGLRSGQTEAASTWYKIMFAYGSSGSGIYLEQAKDYFLDEEYSSGDDVGTDLRFAATDQLELAQGFRTDTAGKVEFIDVYIVKNGSPTGNVWLTIQTDSSGVPSNTIQATSDKLDVSKISTSNQWVRFVFRIPFTVSASTQYHIVMQGDYALSAGVNNLRWRADNSSSTYPNGTASLYGTGGPLTWTAVSGRDFLFKLYVTRNDNTPTPPSGYNTSYAHIGWVYNDSGSNFDPFTAEDRSIHPLEKDEYGSITATIPTITDLSAAIPPGIVDAELWGYNTTTSVAFNVRPVPDGFAADGDTNDPGTSGQTVYIGTGSLLPRVYLGTIVTESQAVYARVVGGSGTFFIVGFTWSESNIGTPAGAGGTQVWLLNDTNEAYYTTANVGIGTGDPGSKLEIHTTSLGVTQTTSSGLALVNSTAAAAGAQQISPSLRWSGSGWKTDATAASQAVDFRSYVVPVQGTANPTGYLTFQSSINGAAYGDRMIIDSSGNVGIGTTGPGAKLDIRSTTLNDSMRIVGDGTNGAVLRFYNGATHLGNIGGDGTDSSTISVNRNTGGSRNFRVYDGTTNVTLAVDGGSVGIGTTPTLGKVHIQGSADEIVFTVQNISTNGLRTRWYDGRSANNSNTNNIEFHAKDSGGSDQEYAFFQTVISDNTAGSEDGDFAIHTTRAGTRTEAVRFQSDGQIKAQAIYDTTTGSPVNVTVTTDGRLVRSTSSARYKTNIEPMADWRWLLEVEPITFNDNKDPNGRTFGGLLAEDVAAKGPINEDGIPLYAALDKEGRPDDVAYPYLTAPIILGLQEHESRLTVIETALGLVVDQENRGITLNNVKAIMSISGKWSISEDGVLIAEKVKADVLETKKGVTIEDRSTGQPYCAFVDNGIMKTEAGACDAVSAPAVAGEQTTSETPVAEPVTEPVSESPVEPTADTPPTSEPVSELESQPESNEPVASSEPSI